MSSNQEIIQKADMALADLATAGKLNPQQTNRFLKNLMDSPTIIPQVRTVFMTGPEMKINKIGFGSRVLRPAVEDTALSAGDRVKPDLGQVVLNTKEFIAELRIPYSVLEDNIEGGRIDGKPTEGAGGIHATIVDLLGQRAARDLEELALQGDTASGDAYLATMNGWLKLCVSNAVAAGGAVFTKDLVKAAVKAMPDRYLRDRNAMKHFVSVDNETELRDQYGERATSLGDSMVQGNLPLRVFGSTVEGAAMIDPASALFTNPKNLIFGIQRDITLEFDKDITRRQFIVVLTTRVALQVEETLAAVKTTGIAL